MAGGVKIVTTDPTVAEGKAGCSFVGTRSVLMGFAASKAATQTHTAQTHTSHRRGIGGPKTLVCAVRY